jgi:CheY-like chemotaxis protein
MRNGQLTLHSFETKNGGPHDKDGLRILVVEGNRDDSDFLVRQLRKHHLDGHVKIIPDGEKAWDFLAAKGSGANLIAIFLDLHLPSLSGLNLLCRIKSHPQLRAIPAIVMTSTDTIQELEECIRLGVDGFIAKPVTFTAFTKTVADIFHPPVAWSMARSE